MEAEYRALTATAQEITWLSALLGDLGIPQTKSTLLQCDNLSAVYLSANPALHNQLKHFDTDWHYIREQVALGLIETKHIPAKEQLEDIFTKPLTRRPFSELRDKLRVGKFPTSSLRGEVSQQGPGTPSPVKEKPINYIQKKTRVKTVSEKKEKEPLELINKFTILGTLNHG
ncbi:unnamed protein product [Microthlaspi erraticum]|uniref:Reverse transcriptase Ty1/copia-type domain-containing protein n=1 Tax=Microthlaspi erraticum TaxID=1685480 RepID=A0A6D2HR69_9BRAS|nr:unnamed protein product [Microthlaspi erraticum]